MINPYPRHHELTLRGPTSAMPNVMRKDIYRELWKKLKKIIYWDRSEILKRVELSNLVEKSFYEKYYRDDSNGKARKMAKLEKFKWIIFSAGILIFTGFFINSRELIAGENYLEFTIYLLFSAKFAWLIWL